VVAILFALAAALGYGGSDFAAGLASREASVIRVTILAEMASVVLMLLVVPEVSTGSPSLASAGWAVAAGVGGMAGAMALYLGFRHAAFSVAAPLSAVASASFSVLAGLLFGEHPGGLALTGIALALPAIVAVSASPADQATRPPSATPGSPDSTAGLNSSPADPADRVSGTSGTGPGGGRGGSGRQLAGVLYGLAAGAGFGVLFIGLNRAGSGGDLWPAVIAQVAGLALASVLATARGQLRLPPRRASWLAVLTGVTGGGGTLCFFVATHAGLLAVTAVITSLYPATTILMARLLVGERLTVVRLAGLGLAAASVALIAIAGAG
jgi:drug/metabolite transporter (DMT)-like permease